jgi:hypothetical protein
VTVRLPEDASKSRNGAFIPMVEFLLYANMMCSDADALLLRIEKNRSEMPPAIVLELVETVKESVPECRHYWDAND